MIRTGCPDGGFEKFTAKLKEHHGSIQEKERANSHAPNTNARPSLVPREASRCFRSSPATRGDRFKQKTYARQVQWTCEKYKMRGTRMMAVNAKTMKNKKKLHTVSQLWTRKHIFDTDDRIGHDIVCGLYCAGCDLDAVR